MKKEIAIGTRGSRLAQVQCQWVVKAPAIAPTYLADVRMTQLKDAPGPLPRVSRARVDHGTAEILAKIVLADCESLPPGESGYAQIRFERRALVYPGDQFIARSVTPVTTIGGGQVIDASPHKHGTGPRWHERLALLEKGPADAVASLLLEEAFPLDLSRRRLVTSPYLWRFDAQVVRAAVAGLLADGRAVPAGGTTAPAPATPTTPVPSATPVPEAASGASATSVPPATSATSAAPGAEAMQRLFFGPALAALEQSALARLRTQAERDVLDPYLSLGELRRELAGGKEWPALDAALERLTAAGELVRTEHGFRWAQSAGGLEGEQAGAAQRLLEQFEAAPLAPGQPPSAEVASVAEAAAAVATTPAEAQKLVDALVRGGRLVKVGEDLYYPTERLDQLMSFLSAAIEQSGQVTLAEVRDLLGTSRRFAQALLEHMDSEGLTLRVGDARRLRRRRR